MLTKWVFICSLACGLFVLTACGSPTPAAPEFSPEQDAAWATALSKKEAQVSPTPAERTVVVTRVVTLVSQAPQTPQVFAFAPSATPVLFTPIPSTPIPPTSLPPPTLPKPTVPRQVPPTAAPASGASAQSAPTGDMEFWNVAAPYGGNADYPDFSVSNFRVVRDQPSVLVVGFDYRFQPDRDPPYLMSAITENPHPYQIGYYPVAAKPGFGHAQITMKLQDTAAPSVTHEVSICLYYLRITGYYTCQSYPYTKTWGNPVAVVPTTAARLATTSPVQAVEQYYQAINDRQYDVSWGMLSDAFIARVNPPPNGHAEYLQWWTSVSHVDVLQVSSVRQSGASAVVYAKLQYRLQDGRTIPDTHPNITLVWDANLGRWFINDKR